MLQDGDSFNYTVFLLKEYIFSIGTLKRSSQQYNFPHNIYLEIRKMHIRQFNQNLNFLLTHLGDDILDEQISNNMFFLIFL